MAKVGRKSKYHTHIEPHLEDIRHMRQNGSTYEEIFKTYKVSEDSFYKYIKKFPELAEVLKESKEALVGNIKASVFQTAMGGFVKTKKKFKHIQGKKILISSEEEIMAPNTTAQAIALKILDPEARYLLSNNVEVKVDTEAFDASVDLVKDILASAGVKDEQ